MKKILYILLFLPALAKTQYINRGKSFQNIGVTGIAQYSGTTAQRPTGDFRFARYNTDSNRYEIKINSTTWRGLLFNGEAAAGGGGSGTVTSVTGTSNRISVATGTTTPVIDIDAAYVGQTSITTLGTIGTGTWSATAIGLTKGGTGQITANASFNALAPSQTSNSGKYLTTDGTNTSWASLTGITASDTAALTNRSWRIGGNTAGSSTYSLGTADNNNWNFLANGTIVGRVTSTGQFLWGSTSSLSANYGEQFRKPFILFATPTGQNEFAVDDDGANNSNATVVFNTSGTNNRTLLMTTLSANVFTVRQYGQTADVFTIGANAGSTNPGVPLTHLYADAATSGKKWSYGAYNTFTSASGEAFRYAFEDSTIINHSVSTGAYGSFRVNVTCTSCQATDFAFKNNINNNFFNTTSGNTGIGLAGTAAPSAKLQVSGTVKLDAMTIGTSTSPILVKDADSVIRQVTAANFLTANNITSANYTPTIGNQTNVAASSLGKAHYYRTGNHVIVYLQVNIDPTSVGATEITITLPVASALAGPYDAMGLGNCQAVVGQAGIVQADFTGDRALFAYTASDLSAQNFYISFSYEIL